MNRISRLGAAILAVGFLPIWVRAATPQDVPAADPATLTRELEAAEKKRQSSSSARRADIYAALGRAAAGRSDAAGLYEEAVKNTFSEEKEEKPGKGKKTAKQRRWTRICCAPTNSKPRSRSRRGICS